MRPILLPTVYELPRWLTRADGAFPTILFDFTTEGVQNHYWGNRQRYYSANDLLTALGGSFTGPAGRYRTNASGLLESVGSNVLRFDYDPVTLAAKGILLEGARTNLALQSQTLDNASWTKIATTISADADVAPDGTTTADRIVEDGTTTYRGISGGATFVAGQPYTISAYAKSSNRTLQLTFNGAQFSSDYANFDLSSGTVSASSAGTTTKITAIGGGVYRCSLTATATASGSGVYYALMANSPTAVRAVSYAGDGISYISAWGLQLEQASVASSYIPTTTTSVTRTAEILSWTDTAPTSETIYLEFDLSNPSGAQVPWQHDDGTAANRNLIYASGTGAILAVVASSATQASVSIGTVSAQSPVKAAGSFAANDFNGVVNGGSVGTDSSGTMPGGLVTHRLGKDHVADALFGHISKFAYWHGLAASNAALQSLTA